tara:strand:- start:1980 stop:2567 length:588 start_codon:yes stop_codon:yes gene_type:complete
MRPKDRIKELKRVRASELIPNPKNWRTHPQEQQEAVRGILEEVGYSDALLARETVDGLMLIDGHLRAELTPTDLVPVLVLDVTEAEADKLLATIDPLSAMAGVDDYALTDLISGISMESEQLRNLLKDMSPTDWLTDISDDYTFKDTEGDQVLEVLRIRYPMEKGEEVNNKVMEALQGMEGVELLHLDGRVKERM